MAAIIYLNLKNPMQSGKAREGQWILEYEKKEKSFIDPVMGWSAGSETLATQVKMNFCTQDAAIKYAKQNNVNFTVINNI